MTSGKFRGGVGPLSDEVGPDLEALRERFWHYSPKDRNHERHGVLVWELDRDRSIFAEIQISEHPEYGFAVLWILKPGVNKPTRDYFTVGDESKLSEEYWIDAADQDWVLQGNFVPLSTAWAIIEDFFTNPMTLSRRAVWIDTEEMPEFPT